MESKEMRRLRRELTRMRKANRSWRDIAGQYPGVPAGTLNAILKSGYEPKSPKMRQALGLRYLAEVPSCPKCGGVHVSRRCPVKRSFAEQSEAYERWRKKNEARLAQIVDHFSEAL